ncbi:MAG: DUF4118 domain-containing protein [Candidatus Obscuribacterales bacterium]
MTGETRRNPDAILAQIKQQEAHRLGGRLKIFFGAVAGVGKTYSMLQAARALQSVGVDVVVGWVETHGRKETEALLEGLEILPPARVSYRGRTFSEFDLDAALKRKPELILVDELAHTNIPGCRHEKRWQDIEELLEARIDVFTTLNVQHVESINDIVRQITGVSVRERVPDSFLEQAIDIEMVDLPPDELLKRLEEGKVYVAKQAQHAVENFFRKGNLIALRELALRLLAERVDAQMEDYRKFHKIKHPWPAGERILVCISPSPLSTRLVRAARRMAAPLRAQWLVAYVETPAHSNLPEVDRNRVMETLRLAEQLGGQTLELSGDNISDEVIKCAIHYNVTKIIIGKPRGSGLKDRLLGNVVDDVVRKSGPIDVYVITGDESTVRAPYSPVVSPTSHLSCYLKAAGVIVACTVIARTMLPYFELSNVVMAYILGVVIVATRYGRGPSILSSVLSVAAFDFFFVPPFHTFVVADTQYLVTFAVMLVIAIVISTLTVRVRQQADTAGMRERRTAALYSMSKELASHLEFTEILDIGMQHVSEVFDCKAAVFYQDTQSEKIEVRQCANQALSEEDSDIAVAEWVLRNKQNAGLHTATLPASRSLYLPLRAGDSCLGVLAVCPLGPHSRLKTPDQLRLLETFASQIALSSERARLSIEAETTRLSIKTEQLRNSLLSSVSHDLRTPLATITGAASSIMSSNGTLELHEYQELGEEIYQESVRLNKLVVNLLEMTKVESGTLVLKRDRHPADELIGAAINAVDKNSRKLQALVHEDTPLVFVDAVLIQQVLVNLIENAIKYAPGEPVEITVQPGEQQGVLFEIADRGPGIPRQNKKLIFEKFYREKPNSGSGVGLGLAICQGIVEAHGGRIWVEDRPGGGSSFKFELPPSR